MNKSRDHDRNSADARTAQAFAWDSDPFLARVPASIREQVEKHGRRREPGRQALIEELQHDLHERMDEYDRQTREYQGNLLQVYEMSLQSKPRRRNREPERER